MSKRLTIANVQKQIRLINERADDAITKLADDVENDIIAPYFKRRGMTYMSGNGTWLILDKHGEQIDTEQLPRRIQDALTTDVGNGLMLGFYIGDIRP